MLSLAPPNLEIQRVHSQQFGEVHLREALLDVVGSLWPTPTQGYFCLLLAMGSLAFCMYAAAQRNNPRALAPGSLETKKERKKGQSEKLRHSTACSWGPVIPDCTSTGNIPETSPHTTAPCMERSHTVLPCSAQKFACGLHIQKMYGCNSHEVHHALFLQPASIASSSIILLPPGEAS